MNANKLISTDALSSVETIFFYAEPQFESISSSVVRELKNFGKDITEFLPKGY